MVCGKLHNEGSGITGKHFCFFQHDTGNNNSGNTDEIGAGSHPPCTAEESRGNQGDNRQLCAAGDKGGGHDRHTAVSLVFNGTGGHNSGNAAAGTDEHRDERLAGKTEFAENTVQHKSDSGHVAAGFQERQENKKHQHLGYKAENCADTADDTVKEQTVQPFRAVCGFKTFLGKNGNAGDPHTVCRRVRHALCFFSEGFIINCGNIIAGFCQRIGIRAVGFVKRTKILFCNGRLNLLGADNTFFGGGIHRKEHFVGPDLFNRIIGHCFLISGGAYAK